MAKKIKSVDEDHQALSDHESASPPEKAVNRGISIADLVLRLFAAIGAMSSAVAMGMTTQTHVSFSSQVGMLKAQFNDLPSFTFFVVSNSIVCAYLVLSLALSLFHIFKSTVAITRAILIIFDTIMLALITAGASAAATIVYLAHNGSESANWVGICHEYSSLCERVSGSLTGAFIAAIALIVLVILSAVAITRR